MCTPIAGPKYAKRIYPEYESKNDLTDKLINKWNTEYLPNINIKE